MGGREITVKNHGGGVSIFKFDKASDDEKCWRYRWSAKSAAGQGVGWASADDLIKRFSQFCVAAALCE